MTQNEGKDGGDTDTRHGPRPPSLPLGGMLVVDATRMLPGAVAARTLLELGARVIKIEAPRGGDPLRAAPPHRGGIGSAYCLYYAGAQSLRLDLRTPSGIRNLQRLLGSADVFIESFRPGTLAKWGLDLESDPPPFPRMISCSMPAFASRDAVGHDLNFVAMSGLLDRLGSEGATPKAQIADTMAGFLACGAIVASLLARERGNAGRHIRQPLVAGPLPFLTLGLLDTQLGAPGLSETLLDGCVPAYRNYACADGQLLACACLEPKFWVSFTERLGLPELSSAGLDRGPRGTEAARRVQSQLQGEIRDVWLERFEDLPVAAFNRLDEFAKDPRFEARCDPLFADLPLPDGSFARVPGPVFAGVGSAPEPAAPTLGLHDELIAREFGLEH